MGLLNKKIISFDPEIFGLDLSDLSIKIVQLVRDGDGEKVRSFVSVEIPDGNIDDGKIINKDVVATIIKDAISKAGPEKIKTNKVICSLPESKVFLRIISIPRMDKEEAEEAIKWEMEANIPIPIDQAYYDWQFLDSDKKDKINVLTVAIAQDIVDDIMSTLSMAGLEVYGLEVESIASARSLISEAGANEAGGILIVDLGAQRTSFIVVEKGITSFTSSIPFSSESINDAIAKGLNLNIAAAEKIKLAQGIEADNSNPVFGVIKSLLENLVQEIEKTADFYAGISKDNASISKIVLCGGGANLKGLPTYLAERLKKEVELGDPWVNVKIDKNLPIISKDNAGRFSTAIGLALRGLEYEDQS